MFENLAAIDIGTSSIKVITVKTGIKDFQIKSFAYEDVDHDIDHHEVAIKDTLTRILEGHSLKGYKILTGIRGEPPKDLEAIKGLLAKLSEIAVDNPEIKEIDLNPVIVHEKGISVVDSRVILE